MPLGSPYNHCGGQIGAKNKATLLTSTLAETLMKWEESLNVCGL
jgi:hypothetical protein